MADQLQVGLSFEKTITVTENHAARHLGRQRGPGVLDARDGAADGGVRPGSSIAVLAAESRHRGDPGGDASPGGHAHGHEGDGPLHLGRD